MNDMTEPGAASRPFPGLRPFTYEDHDFYFGRTSQIYSLYRLLDGSRFVAVVGNSGSGKSSLVFAGLHPLLDKEKKQEGGSQWVWGEMSPKNAPLEELTRLLLELAAGFTPDRDSDPVFLASKRSRIEYLLRLSSNGLVNALAEIEGLKDKSLVIVVDQFEELFRYASPQGHDPAQRARQREEAVLFVQLLLAASQHPDSTTRILLTMRSDFIGDCAIFRGLPEAVSQTQFLVPGMTREQFAEVIRKPIAACNAEIETGVVERLLIDISDEADQLPVLQHCLLRLWERAKLDDAGKRHITVDDYTAVGRISGALSQHADAILEELGLNSVVEGTFRALSETDKEGRATRRTLTFSQLKAETGAREDDLRKVVDRFRADDCSFLRPMVSASPALFPETQIDVGHEALLRHWEKVSGDPAATGSPTDTRPIGWLVQEARDSRRFQALLYQGELPLSQVKATADWWSGTSRTEGWARRYGGEGDYARAKAILDRGQAALAADDRKKASTRLWKQGTFAVVCILLAIAIVLGAKFYKTTVALTKTSNQLRASLSETTQARNAAETAQQKADAVSQTEENLANDFVGSILNGLNRGDISSAAALSMADISSKAATSMANVLGNATNGAPGDQNTAAVNALFAKQLLTVSDIYSAVGNHGDSQFEQINKANALAQNLVNSDPTNDGWQVLLYNSLFRIGDVLVEKGPKYDPKQGLATYQTAQGIAQKLVDKNPDDGARLYDLAFAENKVGEGYQVLNEDDDAIASFKSALPIATKVGALPSPAPEWQAILPATFTKIGSVLVESAADNAQIDQGIAQYEQAIAKQESILSLSTVNNDIVASNLANSHRLKGDALIKEAATDRTKFAPAFDEYEQAAKTVGQLLQKDRRADWLGSLAMIYEHYARGIMASGDSVGAAKQYQNELGIWQELANKDKTNQDWQQNLANTVSKLNAIKATPAKSNAGATIQPKP